MKPQIAKPHGDSRRDPLWSLEAGLRETVDWYRVHIDDIVATTGAGQPR